MNFLGFPEPLWQFIVIIIIFSFLKISNFPEFYIFPPLKEFRLRNSHTLAHTNTCICNNYSSSNIRQTHLHPKMGKDRWPASCPRVPKLPPPILGVATTLSLASRSCVAKPDINYLIYAQVPPRRSHLHQR